MQLMVKLSAAILAGVVLAGCYTGEIPLEKRFIRDYRIRSSEEDGKTHLRITGRCGLPMGISSCERRIEGSELILNLVISEKNHGDRQIDEQFVIPGAVSVVKLGDEIIWKRADVQRRRMDDGWDL